MADFARNPLARYPEPAYPEFCHHRTPSLSTVGAVQRAIAAALVTVGAGGIFYGCLSGAPPSDYLDDAVTCVVSEELAREVLREELEARGYTISEDFPVCACMGETVFEADGYDEAAGIGYEYQAHSEGDSLDYAVQEMLWNWSDADGPFFLVLDETSYTCDGVTNEEEAALARLRSEVEDFFRSLADQGVL